LGALSVNSLANGGVASSIGASTNAAANLVMGNVSLIYTGGTASTNRNFTLLAAEPATVIDVANAAANLTITGASTVNGGAVNKRGAGTLTLAGNNGWTGPTTVSAGTLAAGTNNALAAGNLTIAGGTYDLGTFSDTVGTVTLVNGTITGSTGVLTGTSYAVQNGSINAILAGGAA
jgi:fibronectin-binding autotransporter adhesin